MTGGEKYILNKRIATGFMSIAGALAIAGGATFAYFTDTVQSAGNTFSTGTLNVDILDQNQDTGFVSESIVTDWTPGETAFVSFDVKNTGSLPVNLKGQAGGTWNDTTLDAVNAVKVIKLERWNGADWETLRDDVNGIVGDFYYSPNGTNASLFEVAPNERAQLRLTVELDTDAGNNFQNKTFTATLQVDAKQTNTTTF